MRDRPLPARNAQHRTHLDTSAARPGQSSAMVPLFFLALIAAHAFDLVSFIVMTDRHGMGAEANPVVVMLAEQIGVGGLTVVKIASVLIGGSVFVMLAYGQRRRLAMGVVLFGVAAGLVGGLTNLATIYAY
jgi:hypothetical protein